MSKRRRTSSASRGHEDDSLDGLDPSSSIGPTMRKRKKYFDPIELCHQLYDIIRTHKKTDGSLLCDSFIRVPKRRQEPKYYDVVTNPIDLLKVQQKLKMEEYEDLEDLQNDIELIVNNTKAFYKRSTQEYKDANELWDLFNSSKNKLMNTEDDSRKVISKTPPKATRKSVTKSEVKSDVKNNVNHKIDLNKSAIVDDEHVFEELFSAVMKAKDDNNKPLYTHFQLLPSKKKYPEYYEVIEQPIDLKFIAQKIQGKKYSHLIEMERDLLLMCKNACLFNEPGSQIHKQAKTLKQFIQTRKWMENIKTTYVKNNGTNNKSRIKRSKGTSINATAILKGEESEYENIVQNDDQVDHSNPQWKLFETVSTATGNNGVPLSEPFWKLPSRRIYPDYYREIKNPMSLGQIKRKLEKKSYGTISEVAGDLTIMFENAKKYNITTSKLYKDAVKLQKMMQSKVQELLDIDQSFLQDSENFVRKKPGPKPKNLLVGLSTPQRGRPPKDYVSLKKRLHSLAKYLLDFTCEDGRKPMLAFMEKPSKKLYPEYYEIIAEPIDFLEIEAKIKAEQYSCENDLVRDFKLMFSNCREFNEENSPIYEDANLLEKYMTEKVIKKKPGPSPEKVRKEKPILRVYKPRKPLTPLERTLRTLFDAIRDYREPKDNRQLSQIFLKLPSKVDYPDYYEVIKSPIDLEKICHKIRTNYYQHLDDLVADITLMLDNACKYNEPDSQIYKDALLLQRVCFQTKLQLKEDENTIPDVSAAVQDIFLNLFTNVYNYEDDDGRCYSDSMADLPEHDEVDGKKVRALSLDLIKRRLDKGLYKRLDAFQEDFFSCMDRARRLSRTTSQLFEDTIEMQMYFIKQRNELCKNGELLSSPALSYRIQDANSAIEQLRQNKLLRESLEEETETRSSDDSLIKETNVIAGDSMICNQRTFKVGEFVYLDAKEKGCEPHILIIERLFESKGQQMLYGTYYLRPAETYHVSTRKFLEHEVFKSDKHVTVPLEEVRDRCCVVSVKQYYTMRPEGFDDKDVFVCESRYNSRCRSFKKIKIYPENPTIKLVPREIPLEPKRVMSVFRERVEKHKDELAELEEQEKLIEKDKPNVVAFTYSTSNEGNTYYEQFNTICSGVVKTGDYVYVVVEGGKQIIAQIDTIWETQDGKCYFRGPWFIKPSDIPHTKNKLFYKQEVFLSSLEDTHPIVSIIGKCAVLDYNDYIMYRPTEIPETDVFICASMYDEINQQIRKLLTEGLRKYTHTPGVTEDEIYYFTKLLNPLKVPLEVKPVLLKSKNSIIDLEEYLELKRQRRRAARKLKAERRRQQRFLTASDPCDILPGVINPPEQVKRDIEEGLK